MGINDDILSSIRIMIEELLKTMHFDRTISSPVLAIKQNKYTISIQNNLVDVTCSMPLELSVGQIVWVKIPCGSLEDMHICGIKK